MSVDTAIQQDLHKNLTFIRQYFMHESMGISPLFGNGLSDTFMPTQAFANDDSALFMKHIYSGYATFKAAYGTQIDAQFSGKVMTRSIDTPGSAYTPGSAGELSPTSKYYTTEVNLSRLLTANGSLITAMDALRTVYSLLDPMVYDVYRGMIANGTTPSISKSFTVHKYSLTTENKTAFVVDDAQKLEQIKSHVRALFGITDMSKPPLIVDSDIVAIRRVLRMHELMANINIALCVYEKTNRGDSINLLNLCNNMLIYANKAMTRDIKSSNTESIPDLALMLRDRAKQYQKDTEDIDVLDKITSNQRVTMKSESERLESRRSREKKSMALQYATLVVTIVVGLVSIGAWMSPMDKKQKLSIIAISFAVGIIVATVLHIVYTKQVENFAGAAENVLGTEVFTSQEKLASDIQNIQNAQFDRINDYLMNTIQLALIMSTFRTYGVMNHVMMKERVFYSNRAAQMENTNTKLATASDAVHLQQSIQKARIYFFISLMVVISLTVLALVGTDGIPGIKNIVLAVAAIVIIGMTFAFFMDTSGRVNTSGQKFYWSAPDTSALF